MSLDLLSCYSIVPYTVIKIITYKREQEFAIWHLSLIEFAVQIDYFLKKKGSNELFLYDILLYNCIVFIFIKKYHKSRYNYKECMTSIMCKK